MSQVNTKIGSSLLKFTFTDDDGEIIASFRMNPADIKLLQRCEELATYFEELREKTPETTTLEDAVKFNDMLEDKICYLLGYDAKPSLFGVVSATAIMGDGNLFVLHVVNKIAEFVGPEIQERKKAMQKAVEKHTAKYTK